MRSGHRIGIISFLFLALLQLPQLTKTEATSLDSITVGQAIFKTMAGEVLEKVGIDQPVVMHTSLQNNENLELSYVVIFDIRNEHGVSVNIIVKQGNIGPQKTIELQSSWKPELTGNFSVRQFVITSFDAPEILSRVESRQLDIVKTAVKVQTTEQTEIPAISSKPPVEVDQGPDKYTILVYMVAADLESQGYAATSDLAEMNDANIPSDINVVIQTGGSENSTIDERRSIDFTKVQRHIIVDNEITTVMDLGRKNMGDSKTLQDFIAWSVTEFPAERYGIILWDHGNGLRGFGQDDVFDDYLTIREMTDAFSAVAKRTDLKFEFIGFDACLMATFEVAMRLSPYGNYLVSSEEIIPEWGWDYKTVLSSFGTSTTSDGKVIGKIIADSYMEHSEVNSAKHENYDANRWVTMSVIDLGQMAIVEDEVIDLGSYLYKYINEPEQAQAVAKTLKYTERYGVDYDGSAGYSDLYELAGNMGQSFPAYKPITDSLQISISNAVVYNVKGESKPNSHGISIFLQMDEYETGEEYLSYLIPEWLGIIERGSRYLQDDTIAPSGWLDYSSGQFEGETNDKDISYGLISFFKESQGSKFEVIGFYYLDALRFLQSDGTIDYELNEGILSLCDGDDCVPAYVYLEDNGQTQFAYFPVRLESGDYDEKVSLIYEITERGEFVFIGAWEGVDDGTAQRGFRPLESGDKIFTYTYEYDIFDDDYSAELESEEIEVTDNFGPAYMKYDDDYSFYMSWCDYAENCASSDSYDL